MYIAAHIISLHMVWNKRSQVTHLQSNTVYIIVLQVTHLQRNTVYNIVNDIVHNSESHDPKHLH